MTGVAPYEVIRSFALSAERAGIDSVWAYDHLLHGPAESPFEIHEAWTILTAIAEATERIGLGTLVLCAEFRNPGLLAKMAATLDRVSQGRLTLGLGCGWNETEFQSFGYASDHRVGRFEDSLSRSSMRSFGRAKPRTMDPTTRSSAPSCCPRRGRHSLCWSRRVVHG